jgi:hypothetical protein
MNKNSMTGTAPAAGGEPREHAIPDLIGQVYEVAPAAERRQMLELLMRPLGVLSLVAVAHGIFAALLFRSGRELHSPLDELARTGPPDLPGVAPLLRR